MQTKIYAPANLMHVKLTPIKNLHKQPYKHESQAFKQFKLTLNRVVKSFQANKYKLQAISVSIKHKEVIIKSEHHNRGNLQENIKIQRNRLSLKENKRLDSEILCLKKEIHDPSPYETYQQT